MATWQAASLEGGRTGIAQDLRKGRRTEVDHLGGQVAARAEAIGFPAPTHAAITGMVHRIERNTLRPGMENIEALLSGREFGALIRSRPTCSSDNFNESAKEDV